MKRLFVFIIVLAQTCCIADDGVFRNRQVGLPELNGELQYLKSAIIILPRIIQDKKRQQKIKTLQISDIKYLERNNFPKYGTLDCGFDPRRMLSWKADLALIDLAGGDLDADDIVIERVLMGICNRYCHTKTIVFIYMFDEHTWNDESRMERYRHIVQLHEKVAEVYRISSLNLGSLIENKVQSGELDRNSVFVNGVLSDQVFDLFLEAMGGVKRQLGCINNRGVLDSTWNMKTYFYEGFVIPDRTGWLDWQYSPLSIWPHVITCEIPEKNLEINFNGDTIGLDLYLCKRSRAFEIKIDDSPWITCELPKVDGEEKIPYKKMLASGIDYGKHKLYIRLPQGVTNNKIEIGNVFVRGEIYPTSPEYAEKDPVKRADLIYSKMPPVEFVPPQIDFAPKTFSKILNKQEVTIVLLGDSIVNDIYSSRFLDLVEKYYGTKINKIASVTGGGNCTRYKGDKEFKKYILDHAPDCVFIGGVSNHRDVDVAIVIDKIQKALPNTEIVLLSDVFGSEAWRDPLKNPALIQDTDPNDKSYNARIMSVAIAKGIPYINIAKPTYSYILKNIESIPFSTYKRDPVHASPRGAQLVGRILFLIITSNYPRK